MQTAFHAALPALLLGAALPVHAQDSVSVGQQLPGDAVSPYNTVGFGLEQSNRYVVDMTSFDSSWGINYALAPISKTSKTNSQFFNSLFGSQAISTTQATGVTTGAAYDVWSGLGFGINNDPGLSNAGSTTTLTTANGNRFSAAFAEFGGTDNGETYRGVITNIVHFDPSQPSRLYVERVVAATNGADDGSDTSGAAIGGVTSGGTVVVRSDDFGVSGSSTDGTLPVIGNNLYLVDASSRDANSLNVLSGNLAANFDAGATKSVIVGSPVTYNVANVAEIGGTPSLISTNFNGEFASGPDFGFPIPVTTHLGTSADQRGNLSYINGNFGPLNSTDGIAALLGYNDFRADQLVVFGLFDAGAGIALPTSTLNLVLPTSVTDNATGFSNIVGTDPNDFAHYQSQVAFQGGSGQIGMNIDRSGNLIVAATADQGATPGISSNPYNYIAVARVSADGSTTEWTMAAYNDGALGGKPVLDGPGGTAIGQIVPTSLVTGTDNAGMSSPMVDSVGNIFFWAPFERFSTGTTVTGLFRAVYDEANFAYELELLFTLGEVFAGQNSGVDYQVRFVSLVDGNSISSSAPFSGNISEEGFAGQKFPAEPNSSPLHLGGLVLGAEIVYDVNGDGNFDDASADPLSPDEDYQVLLYISGDQAVQPDLGSQGPGGTHLSVVGDGLGLGETSTIKLSGAPANAPTFLVLSTPGAPNLPVGNGELVSGFGIVPGFPLSFVADGNGDLAVPLNGNGNNVDFVLQFATVDLSLFQFASISNAVLLQFGN